MVELRQRALLEAGRASGLHEKETCHDYCDPGAVSPLRQRSSTRCIDGGSAARRNAGYIRDGGRFATFLGRSPDMETAADVRRFQVDQHDLGVPVPTMNTIVSAMRSFFTQTLDRPHLVRKLVRLRRVRKLPVVLSQDEVVRLLAATTRLKHQAALSVAYGAGLRAADVAALKVRDIDSERMLLWVERGKGGARSRPSRASIASVAERYVSSPLRSRTLPNSSPTMREHHAGVPPQARLPYRT